MIADKAVPLVLSELATLAVANNRDVLTIPFDCQILFAHMLLGNTGGTSGNTDITVTYTAPANASFTSSGTLWTVGTGVGRIAQGSTTKYLEWGASAFSKVYLEAGGTLSLNVTAIPGTASANLLLTLWVVPVND